jgi:hypothetical protein
MEQWAKESLRGGATCIIVVRKRKKGRKFTTDDFMCCVKLAVYWSQSQFAIQVYKLDADCKTKKCNVNRSLNQVAIHAVPVVPIQKQRERTGKNLKSKLEHRQSHVQ